MARLKLMRWAGMQMWPLAAALAVVASMAFTLQASAEEPAATSGSPLTVSIVISPEAIDQLASLLERRFVPQQAREAIAAVLQQAGYDPTELAALLEGHKRHDDDDEGHDHKGNFCEDVLADPADHDEEYVARCQFLQEIGSLTPQQVCDRALANAEADAAFIESLVKRCRNAMKSDEALMASVCASVEAAGEPAKLLQTCLLADLGELTPQETCARALAAAEADEPILDVLIARCKSAIKQGDTALQAELCAAVTAAASAPEALVKKCEWVASAGEREAQKATLREAMDAFKACKKSAPEGEAHEATLARCAAEVQAQFGIEIDTSKLHGFGNHFGSFGDKHGDSAKVKDHDSDHHDKDGSDD